MGDGTDTLYVENCDKYYTDTIEYGSTPYVGLTMKNMAATHKQKFYFRPKTSDTVQLEAYQSDIGTF